MARKSGSAKGLQPDRLVEELGGDPFEAEAREGFVGLLGRSSTEGHWRLYFKPTLENYIEFREEDVLATRPLGERDSDGTVVILRRDAPVNYTTVGSAKDQSTFLQGDIASRLWRTSGQLGGFDPSAKPKQGTTWHDTGCNYCSFMCCETF